jgi:tetratricopeptide (TPR) repeat protein
MSQSKLSLFVIFVIWPSLSFGICPNLDAYQLPGQIDGDLAERRLKEVFDQCLLSSEYFSLLGSAQLSNGRLSEALDSLERALLLNPDNGAALIDYSEALLRDGQLFAALEINKSLLSRHDAPPGLGQQLEQRQRDWESLIRETNWRLDFSGGYDDNLNGSPDEETIALTLSGEPIFLKLNEDYQAVSGPLINTRIMMQHRRLAPEHQDNFTALVRGRLSDDPNSDVVQLSGSFSRTLTNKLSAVQVGAGASHLLFGGQSLFSGADLRYRHQIGRLLGCGAFLGAALQHQTWHQQKRLDGLEAKASAGTNCNLSSWMPARLVLETSLLHNSAMKEDRLGGDRVGWQVSAEFQLRLGNGAMTAQILHTDLLDRTGFSPLLADNARRGIRRTSALLQYREPINWLGTGANFIANLYHQGQHSNLDLFETTDTSFEIGFSWEF